MIYNNKICFRHSDENLTVTFNLKSIDGNEMHFEVLTHFELFETQSTTKFITADIQEMQQTFLRIYNNPLNFDRFVVCSSDSLTEIAIVTDKYRHVIISFVINKDLLNIVQTEIKTDLASLPYLINEIQQCLDVNDGEGAHKNERVGCYQSDSSLRASVEEYFYEEDIYQKFYDVNLFFSSDFVTFSLLLTLYDFEYSKLMDSINENGDFLFYIRPLDHGSVDLSFHGHNHLITFQGNIDNIRGYNISFSSNISHYLYSKCVSSLKTPVNRYKRSIPT